MIPQMNVDGMTFHLDYFGRLDITQHSANKNLEISPEAAEILRTFLNNYLKRM